MTTALAAIRVLALDVDGTLTDGGVWWGPEGEEWKRFCFADVMGVSRAMRGGLAVTLISGEDSPLVDRFAGKLGIADITKGCRDKATALRAYAERHRVALSEICFMGDDVNDLPAMQLAGFSAAPSDAQPPVLARASHVTGARGGHGAVREIIELLLAARGGDPV
jgi:3-deoxy-D-manno-octulosonate 8-phosphate phosphatase (KDO 8-P phosphatase)